MFGGPGDWVLGARFEGRKTGDEMPTPPRLPRLLLRKDGSQRHIWDCHVVHYVTPRGIRKRGSFEWLRVYEILTSSWWGIRDTMTSQSL
jgi:hypothetical protein